MERDPQALGKPEPETAGSERDRLLAIRRRWQRVGRTPMRFGWGRKKSFSTAFLAQGSLFMFLVNYVDSSLRGLRTSPFFWEFTFPISGLGLGLLSAPLYVLSCWLLHRWLTRKTPEDLTVRPLLLVVRWLALGLPMLGLSVIPLWQYLLETKPSWAFSARNAPQMLTIATRAERPGLNVLGRLEPKLMALVILQGVPLVLLTVWIERSMTSSVHRSSWSLATAISVVMHLSQFSNCSLFSWSLYKDLRISARRAVILCGISLLALLPGPYWTSASMLALILTSGIRRDVALARSFVAQDVRRSPLWLDLEQRLERAEQPWWSRWRSPAGEARGDVGDAERKALRRTRLLFSLKAAFLLLDAATLSFLIEAFAQLRPLEALPVRALLAVWGLLSLLIVAVGVPFLILRAVLRRVRSAGAQPRSGLDFPSSGVRVAALFFCGCTLERLFRPERSQILRPWVKSVAPLVFTLILGEALLHFLAMLARRVSGEGSWSTKPLDVLFKRWRWLLATMAMTGLVSGFLEAGHPRALCVVWLSASILSGLLFVFTLLPWFLRPYWVGDILSPELSPLLRFTVALITLSTVLPLGGLTTPFWVVVHRRLWPQMPL